MPGFVQPSEPLASAVLAVLKAAREADYKITRTKLAKLLYLADLDAVEAGRTPFSGATWRWWDYGPFDDAIYRAEDVLVAGDLITRRGRQEYNYAALGLDLTVDIGDTLAVEDMESVRRVVRAYGKKSATALVNLSYNTAPMGAATAGGERGVSLDLNRARRAKQLQALRERYRRRQPRTVAQQDDQGVGEDLLAEMAGLRAARKRANRTVLDARR